MARLITARTDENTRFTDADATGAEGVVGSLSMNTSDGPVGLGG